MKMPCKGSLICGSHKTEIIINYTRAYFSIRISCHYDVIIAVKNAGRLYTNLPKLHSTTKAASNKNLFEIYS